METNNFKQKCYLSLEEKNFKIIHLIITRFMIEFYGNEGFPKKLYRKDYIPNGIRVMKKYLFTSLENQSCKKFIWVLMVGNKANINYIKSLLDYNYSFELKVIYQREFKNIFISTRIDYDDCIYYDAVNDVRKAININKPIIIHGYNRGVYYMEINDKYYDFYWKKKDGVMSIFISLIIVLNKVNDTYSVYDLGDHTYIKKELLRKYKSFGIKEIDYEPDVFDSGDPKFIYVRQKYSCSYEYTMQFIKQLKRHNFDKNKFFGK